MIINGVDQSLVEEWFSPELILSDFVEGDDRCNYELFLLELMNESNYFVSKLKEGKYSHTKEQSHSECDCIGSGYEIDFKIANSMSFMQAKRIFSPQPILLHSGIIIETPPKVTQHTPGYKPIPATIMHTALRGKTVADLEALSQKTEDITAIEKDIIGFLKVICTKKNILLLLPVEFYFEKEHPFEEGYEQIIESLWNDCHASMEYRKKYVNDRDTFLTFYYSDTFVIVEYTGESFKYVDSVHKSKMPTFCHLESYRTFKRI